MKQKLLITLIILIQAVLLLSFFIDDDWYRTNEMKYTLGEPHRNTFLSDQNVTAFVQDGDGRMWIGTTNGLNVYLGKEYEQFYHDPADSASIPSSKIRSLINDTKGNIWVGTANGVARHIAFDRFKRYAIPFTPEGVYQLEKYGDNAVLANNGQDVYIITTDTIRPFHHFNHYMEANSFIYADTKGGYWTVQPMALSHFDRHGQLLRTVRPSDANIACTYRQGDTLWVSQRRTLCALDLARDSIIYASTTPLPIIPNVIYPRNAQHILLSSMYHGLYELDTTTDVVRPLDTDDINLDHEAVTIQCIYGNNERRLWIAYQHNGYQFLSDITDKGICQYTKGKSINILKSMGDVIIGCTTENVFCYNTTDEHHNDYSYRNLFSDSPYYRQTLQDIVPYDDNHLWLITDVRIMSCELRDTYINVITRVFSAEHTGPLLGHSIRIGNDVLVTCNRPYLLRSRFGESDCDSIPIYCDTYDRESLMLPLPDGKILIIMKGIKMATYDPQTNHVLQLPSTQNQCSSSLIPTCALIDAQQQIWIGTHYGGLLRYDYLHHKVYTVTNFPFKSVLSIEENGNQLWIASHDKILTLNLCDSNIQILPNITHNSQFSYTSSCYLKKKNTYIYGTTNGCVIPRHSAFNAHSATPNVIIKQRDGKRIGICPNGQSITLSHDENTLCINPTSNYSSLRSCATWQHKLEGYDTYWSSTIPQTSIEYANLPSGNYTFRLRQVTGPHKVEQKEIILPICIKNSFWQSPAAMFLYIICISCFIYTLFMLRLGHMRRKEHIQFLEDERKREQRTNQMNMNFFINISHEFRNPLTVIAGPLLQLKNDHTLPTTVRGTLDIVCMSINRMLMLIDQMMDFNRLETDDLRLQVTSEDMVSVLQRIILPFIQTARLRDINITFIHSEENLYAWIDSDKIDKVMNNLLTNALKHTPDGGVIKICLNLINEQLRVTVYNSGQHIDDDKIPDLFKRYYQVKSTQASHTHGWSTGIGLYYVKRLITLHHGYINARNETGGVSFEFCLPTTQSAYSADEQTNRQKFTNYLSVDGIYNEVNRRTMQAQQDTNNATHRPIILVVDDDIDVAQYIRSLLCERYIVICRYNADSAIKEVQHSKPALVISDVIMTDTNGLQLCRHIKNDLMTCHIPVILLTAKSSINEQVEGLEAGANAYLTKPFDARYLMAVVESQLRIADDMRRTLSAAQQIDTQMQVLTEQDRNFLDQLYALMKLHISDPDLNISILSQKLMISPTKFNYKLKQLTGETPATFFRKYKLNIAANLLREGQHNVSEIADMVGFGTASYFSVAFKKQFGVPPSEY